MRFTDFMLALPALIFLIVAARIFGDSVPTVVLIVSSIAWMPLARDHPRCHAEHQAPRDALDPTDTSRR